eukprot:COSAG06_NODE_15752_length_1047_cov_1.629747_1_plen_151_part_10
MRQLSIGRSGPLYIKYSIFFTRASDSYRERAARAARPRTAVQSTGATTVQPASTVRRKLAKHVQMVPHNSHLNAIAAMALRLSLLATSAAAAAGRDDVALRGPPPPLVMPIYHVPFNVGKGGCCADINAITEYKGVKHMLWTVAFSSWTPL